MKVGKANVLGGHTTQNTRTQTPRGIRFCYRKIRAKTKTMERRERHKYFRAAAPPKEIKERGRLHPNEVKAFNQQE